MYSEGQLDYAFSPREVSDRRTSFMPDIPDITDSEHWVIETTLTERYGHKVETQIADAEIRLMASDHELSSCPVIYWAEGGCNFIIFKTGSRKYRCQFFYRGYQQYGTGVHEYDDLTECIVSLLQAQADYDAKERGDL
jgi:hypothetical protein